MAVESCPAAVERDTLCQLGSNLPRARTPAFWWFVDLRSCLPLASVAQERKLALYQHIFSYSSVKTIVHWFQLIRLRRLVMYQDSVSANRVRGS